MATSYNGWPASPDKAEIGVVASDVFPGGAKAGDVTIVLGYVARQLDARVEPCIDGWNWGYTYKANVNNPSQLSCHASGTAIDWNAPDHPNGSSGTFTNAQRGTIYQILDEVQGAVSWLEGYDEMHFEICVTAADLAQVAAILGDATPPPTETDWFDDVTKDEMQAMLDAAIGPLRQQLDFLYRNEVLPDLPYTKTAANFNDTRAIGAQLDFLYRNELLYLDDADQDQGTYPFTKTAANFNDTRAVAANVQLLVDGD
jgi:hypothetical protein